MKEKNLYDVVAKGITNGKEAYMEVNSYIEDYITDILNKKNITDTNFIENMCEKVFEYFDDYGNLTQENALKLVSNYIENELILIEYNEEQEKLMKNS
ncbi:MAG: hypothetical protein ACI4XM_00105 [Candidatus Coprovivens sp.]